MKKQTVQSKNSLEFGDPFGGDLVSLNKCEEDSLCENGW